MDVGVDVGQGNLRIYDTLHPIKMMVLSKYFVVEVYRTCSGLEGMSLFIFLLSIIFLLDWRIFRQVRILEIYLIGILYMFFINAVRIASVFSVGYHAWDPAASGFAKSLRGAPIELFHSFVGHIYYLTAFAIFAAIMYRRCIKYLEKSKASQERS